MYVTDPFKIRNGLLTLREHAAFGWDRESPLDGYELRLVNASARDRDFYLRVHRNTSKRKNVAIVTVSRSATHGREGGSYSSPEFLAWVEREIVPLIDQAKQAVTPTDEMR